MYAAGADPLAAPAIAGSGVIDGHFARRLRPPDDGTGSIRTCCDRAIGHGGPVTSGRAVRV